MQSQRENKGGEGWPGASAPGSLALRLERFTGAGGLRGSTHKPVSGSPDVKGPPACRRCSRSRRIRRCRRPRGPRTRRAPNRPSSAAKLRAPFARGSGRGRHNQERRPPPPTPPYLESLDLSLLCPATADSSGHGRHTAFLGTQDPQLLRPSPGHDPRGDPGPSPPRTMPPTPFALSPNVTWFPPLHQHHYRGFLRHYYLVPTYR